MLATINLKSTPYIIASKRKYLEISSTKDVLELPTEK